MATLRSQSLERLASIQSLAIVAACALVVPAGHPWPVAVAALLGFLLLVVARRGRYTPRGSFGIANAISTTRLVGVLWLLTLGSEAPARVVAPFVASLMLLDALDGFVARHRGTASDFGARLDVEADALLVLTLALTLWQRERLGAWVLWPGLLRYAYLLLLALVPGRGQEPRSVTGRLAFVVTVVTLVAALVDGGAVTTAFAVSGALVLTLSFARSLYYTYRRTAR